MTYALKNRVGKFLKGGTYTAKGFGPLDPMRTMLYTNKREVLAMAEFYGLEAVEVRLVAVRISERRR